MQDIRIPCCLSVQKLKLIVTSPRVIEWSKGSLQVVKVVVKLAESSAILQRIAGAGVVGSTLHL